MVYPTNLSFNKKDSSLMHIDLNSCFASVEQQADPKLRGKPVAVAAYKSPSGCIVAPSVEAKEFGVKVGMRVKEGKKICPGLIVKEPDPWKYRNVHLALRNILSDYTADFTPKSIDEFVLDLEGYPAYEKGMHSVAREIKERIKKEVGDWLTVSIGISTNRFLAKTASSLRKPDGLDEINKENFMEVYKNLRLSDLNGIKRANTARLNSVGIYTVVEFCNSDVKTLKAAFNSITGYYWYLRLRGWEIDDFLSARRSYSNSYALPKPFSKKEELSPILTKLVEKVGTRLRRAGYKAKGVHISLSYRDGDRWHKGVGFEKTLFASRDIYRKAYELLCKTPQEKPVREIAVTCFNLIKESGSQLELFSEVEKKESLVDSIDEINERWGNFMVYPAKMLFAREDVPDRIAFGNVKELEEFVKRGT